LAETELVPDFLNALEVLHSCKRVVLPRR
jgi:hypothetical protein